MNQTGCLKHQFGSKFSLFIKNSLARVKGTDSPFWVTAIDPPTRFYPSIARSLWPVNKGKAVFRNDKE